MKKNAKVLKQKHLNMLNIIINQFCIYVKISKLQSRDYFIIEK